MIEFNSAPRNRWRDTVLFSGVDVKAQLLLCFLPRRLCAGEIGDDADAQLEVTGICQKLFWCDVLECAGQVLGHDEDLREVDLLADTGTGADVRTW